MLHSRSAQRQPKPDESSEQSTNEGRLSKDIVRVIRDQGAREHFKQVGTLVRKGRLQIEKKK